MSKYFLIIIWIAMLAFMAHGFGVYKQENIFGKKEWRISWGFAFTTFIPLIWWAGTRQSFIDTGAYIQGFHSLPNTFNEMIADINEIPKDKGFYVLSSTIKIIFGDNATIYLSILAIIQGLSVITIYRKYSCDYFQAIFLFVASTDYLSWMQNGIRQFTAVTIIFAVTAWIIEKKYIPLIVVILLASTIHGSALLMIPIVFIVQEPWNKKTIISVMIVLIAIFSVDKFTNILDTLLSDTQYTNVISDWQMGNDDGTNPLRVLVYSIPTILSAVGYQFIKEENDPIINLACNMGIISTALYLLSIFTSGIFVGRLPIYCSLYSTGILLPWEIKHMFTKISVRVVSTLMIGFYLMFYYYQIHFVWGLI